MTNEQLCALALQTIDDLSMRPVLQDAIEETGWATVDNGRLTHATMFSVWPPAPFDASWDVLAWLRLGFRAEGAISLSFFRAIAAVLLFGDWPTRWELAQRCRLQPFIRRTGIGEHEITWPYSPLSLPPWAYLRVKVD